MQTRHFLTLADLLPHELEQIIQRAIELKMELRSGIRHNTLAGKVLALVFEKSSTRTRVSFETGMIQLGGNSIFLSSKDTQLGRGETVEDSARVLARMVDIITVRTFGHEKIQTFANSSTVPVINALTDEHHPCQLLADIMTFQEYRGSMFGKTVTWVGDGNNMCNSYIDAASLLGFKLVISCPKGYESSYNTQNSDVKYEHDPHKAVANADLVVTDVWTSMGQEEENKIRMKSFANYQVNKNILSLANEDALVMHCLPAHRGEEITHDVLEGKQSVVWDEAENRLHAQKALLEFLLSSGPWV